MGGAVWRPPTAASLARLWQVQGKAYAAGLGETLQYPREVYGRLRNDPAFPNPVEVTPLEAPCRVRRSTDVRWLEAHKAQADSDGFVHPLHRLRRKTPPIPPHPALVYGSDLVQEHKGVAA